MSPLHKITLAALLATVLESSPLPFDGRQYPSIDLRLVGWPLADEGAESRGDQQATRLQCYTELDASFVDGQRLYRLESGGQPEGRSCLVRVATGTRLTLSRMGTASPDSYVRVLAGSSPLHMPLGTRRIHKGQLDLYGPWHVPCESAYLVFSTGDSSPREWVEFRLERETQEDARTTRQRAGECSAEGAVNHADQEFEGPSGD